MSQSLHAHSGSNLASLPPEVLHAIAFSVARTHPLSLVALLCVSSVFYRLLSPANNSQLYAQLFKYHFDTDAISRRYGFTATNANILADEYCNRMSFMRRLSRCVSAKTLLPQPQLDADLWLAFMIVTEHDEKNLPWLTKEAKIHDFLNIFYSTCFYETALSPGYPPNSVDRCLALYLMYLLKFQYIIDEESVEAANEKFFVLKPYVFAAHKYDAFFGPWTLPQLPLLPSEREAAAHYEAPESENPVVADLHPRSHTQHVHYLGMDLKITPPNITHSAFFSFFARIDRDTGNSLLSGTDVTPPVFLDDVMDVPSLRLGRLPAPKLISTTHDPELKRLMACHDPISSPGLPWNQFRGAFEGTWEGRFCYFDFDSYRDMLGGRMRSLYEGPFGDQPQVWKLEEKVVYLKTNHRAQDSLPWVSQTSNQGNADSSSFGASASATSSSDSDNSSNNNYEISLTGAGHSAWGQFNLSGRIRPWDGLFTLYKSYTPDTRGEWIYRGYYHQPSRCLLGRWRDTLTGLDLHGYEGTFAMYRRDGQ